MQTMYVGQLGSPVTELSQALNSTATTVYTKNASVFPSPPNLASIGEGDQPEVILYTGKIDNSLTGVTRGFGGSLAQSWELDTVIARVFTTYDQNTFRENILTLNTDKIETSLIGAANGIASLGSDSKVPIIQIPIAVANGVASLDGSTKIPIAQIPTATANGVASLDGSVKIPIAQIPTATANGVASLDGSAQVPANQLGNVVTTIPNQNLSGVTPIKIWVGTQVQYDSIGTKSSDTLYFILE